MRAVLQTTDGADVILDSERGWSCPRHPSLARRFASEYPWPKPRGEEFHYNPDPFGYFARGVAEREKLLIIDIPRPEPPQPGVVY